MPIKLIKYLYVSLLFIFTFTNSCFLANYKFEPSENFSKLQSTFDYDEIISVIVRSPVAEKAGRLYGNIDVKFIFAFELNDDSLLKKHNINKDDLEKSLKLVKYYQDKGDFAKVQYILEYFIKHGIKSDVIYDKLGNLLIIQGKYSDALEMFKKQNNNYKIASTYYDMGDYNSAINYLNKEKNNFDSIVLLGQINSIWGEKKQADNYFNNAEKLAKNNIQKLTILINKGKSSYSEGNYTKALELFKEASNLSMTLNDWSEMPMLINYMSDIYLKSNNVDFALKLNDEAFKLSKKAGSKVDERLSLFIKGNIYEKKGDLNGAKDNYIKSLGITEDFRKSINVSEEQKSEFMSQYFNIYESLIPVLVKKGETELAFNYAEKAKARSFLEEITEKSLNLSFGVDKTLLEKKLNLENKIGQITTTLGSIGQNDTRRNYLTSDRETAYSQLQDVTSQIKKSSPKYSQIYYPEPLGIKDVQNMISADTGVLEFFVGNNSTIVWLIKPNSYKVYVIPVSKENLTNKVSSIIDPLVNANITKINKEKDEYLKLSNSLYNDLIKPIIPDLGSTKKLLIVSDNILNYLPFELLVKDVSSNFNDSTYLINDYSISYALSSTVHKSLISENTTNKKFNKQFLGFGNPSFDLAKTKVEPKNNKNEDESFTYLRGLNKEGVTSWLKNLQPLPNTLQEVKNVSNLFQKEKTSLFLGNDAQKDSFLSESKSSKIIHVATHGFLNENKPLLSNLVFSYSKKQKTPSILYAYEIMENSFSTKPDLVVLSACETGRGKLIKGEGVVGLTRAFLISGSQSVLSSLWSVADRSTSDLMTNFYNNLSKGMDKDLALQQAKISMIKDKKNANPFFWAPFILVGNNSKINFME